MSMSILLLALPLAALWLKTTINLLEFTRLRRDTAQRLRQNLCTLPAPQAKCNDARLFIITPALNEQERIANYIAHLIQRLVTQPNLQPHVVIVCNDIEQPADSSSYDNHTWEVAARTLSRSSDTSIAARFDVIRYAGDARRPGQINQACHHLITKHGMSRQDFILLLDVDATLDEGFFYCVASHIQHTQADLAQAQCIYKPKSADRHYERVAAQWQNYFMLSRERGRLMRRERLNSVGVALKDNFWYTANGVVMRYSLVESIGGFVENCKVDDLSTSCLISSTGCRVALLDTFLSVDQVSGGLADFRQKLFWCSSYVEMFKLLKSAEPGYRPRAGYIAFRLACFFVWLLRAPVILGMLLACLLSFELVYVSLFSYATYLASSYAFPLFFLPQTRAGRQSFTWLLALYGAFYPLLQSFVPWAMLLQKLPIPVFKRRSPSAEQAS